jgi:hypothetical protein
LIVSNPLHAGASDFHLQFGSPYNGAGINVGLTQDFGGTVVPATPAIGAYEFI